MRFARVVLGLLLALVGLLVTIAGAVSAFWLVGPDSTIDTGEQHLASKGLALMTAPDLLDRHGPTLHVTAAGSKRPVFVGIGRDLDVSSYLGAAQYTRVVRLNLPPKFDTQEMKGGLAPLNPPTGLDWWTVKASGTGTQAVSWPMADGRYDVVVMNADGTPGPDAKVTLGVEVDGLFVTCLLVLLAGLVLLVGGLFLMFHRKRRPPVVPLPVVPPAAQYDPPAYRSPTYQGPVRRTAAVATGVSLLLVATGCASVPPKNVSHEEVSRPAVTVADGQAVVKRYNDINNKANATRDEKLSETIEDEPTLAMTRAGYKVDRKLDAADKKKSSAFTYTKPQIGAPQYGAYPMRFVVSSGLSNSKDSQQLGVWERKNAGEPWALTYSVYPPTTIKVPSMEGLRVPTKADMNKLSSLPQSAAANLAAYFTGGPKSPKAGLFAPSPGTLNLLNGRAKDKVEDTKQSYLSTVTDTFSTSGDPLTFITSTGEALVFLALNESYQSRVESDSTAFWKSGAVTAFSDNVRYSNTLYADYLHQTALVIPLKGKGKLRILSLDTQLVGAGGS